MIITALACLSLLAVHSTALVAYIKFTLIATLLIALCRQLVTAEKNGWKAISHDPESNRWRLIANARKSVSGKLISAGYRSGMLVVLVIETDHKTHVYCPVWQDQVSRCEFSYLHARLKFDTANPTPVSGAAHLKSLSGGLKNQNNSRK